MKNKRKDIHNSPTKQISLSLKRCQSRRAFVQGMKITFAVKPMCKLASLINQSTKNVTFFDLDNSYYFVEIKEEKLSTSPKTINL